MKKEPLNLILLGDPASGKGTQAARLIKKYHLTDLDMGREVRKPEVRKLFDYAHTTGMGKLTPTAIARDIFRRIITTAPRDHGILFNGNPKMINEARLVDRLLRAQGRTAPLVIYLKIPAHETVRRAHKRVEMVAGRAVKRDDDTERALRNRQKYYREQISQVVAFFEKHYTVKIMSGMGTEATIGKKIASMVKKHITQQEKQWSSGVQRK